VLRELLVYLFCSRVIEKFFRLGDFLAGCHFTPQLFLFLAAAAAGVLAQLIN
jgi:hypothetical protein